MLNREAGECVQYSPWITFRNCVVPPDVVVQQSISSLIGACSVAVAGGVRGRISASERTINSSSIYGA